MNIQNQDDPSNFLNKNFPKYIKKKTVDMLPEHHEAKDLSQKRSMRLWTESEDTLLKSMYEEHGSSWKEISKNIEGRTPSQCIQRWRRKFQVLKVRENWTDIEDNKVLKLLKEYGCNWKVISSFLPKTGKQIRERYINKLDPAIKKGCFTKEEDQIIVENYRKFGTKWNLISKKLVGRPQNTIKNRFYSYLKKKVISKTNLEVKQEVDTKEEDINFLNEPGHEKIQKQNFDAFMKGFYPEMENEMSNENVSEKSIIEENSETIKQKDDVNFLSDEDYFLNKYIDFSYDEEENKPSKSSKSIIL